jgi:hypothetical protein
MLAVMTSEPESDPGGWRYAPYRSLRGALQRGRGIAVAELRDRPEHARLVYECTSRDTRWDWMVDDRYTYLARLLRDLSLDPAPLVAQLRACGPDHPYGDNEFDLALGILLKLARAGDAQARDELRRYVRDGGRWIDALQTIACEWPVEWWDDLWEAAAGRIDAEDTADLLSLGEPWQRWRGRDSRLDAAVDATDRRRPARRPRSDLATASDAELLALLRAPDTDRATVASALFRLERREHPVPELLDVVEQLAPARPAGLFGALLALGTLAAPAARRWAADADHPLFRSARHLLAEHGDERDLPVLLAALDRHPDDWCPYDDLAEGLARILAGSPAAAHADTRAGLIRRLRRLTTASPHSYERTAYLRALLLLDPQGTTPVLPIHLLDCEPGVRLLAARNAPLTDDSRRRLTELRDDPIEEDEVRRTAAQRLSPATA